MVSIRQVVKIDIFFKTLALFEKIFLVAFFYYLYLYYFSNSPLKEKYLGGCFLFFSLFGFCFLANFYFNHHLKNPPLKGDQNLEDFLEYDLARIFFRAEKKSRKTKKSFALILMKYLLQKKESEFFFSRLYLSKKSFQKELEKNIKVSFLKEKEKENILKECVEICFFGRGEKISFPFLFAVVSFSHKLLEDFFKKEGFKKEDFLELSFWQKKLQKRVPFFSKEKFSRIYGIGRDWAEGYTPTLDNFSRELTKEILFNPPEETFHQKELQELEEILSKREANSCLLVGVPGTGKRNIILNFCKKVNQGKTFSNLNFKRVIEIDMPGLIGYAKGNVEAFLKRIFEESIFAGNVILVLRQIHNFIGFEFGVKEVGKIDISAILSQYLHLPQFRIIATTTSEGFRKTLDRIPEILSYFTKVDVKELGEKETLKVLEIETKKREKRANVFFTYPALKEIIYLCKKYIGVMPFPLKAIRLLDEITIYELSHSKKAPGIVLREEVDAFFSEKTEIPVGEIKEKEKEVLLNLEKILHQRIVDQEEAIKELSSALRRARAEIGKKERPLGVFLFLGPTGVGKTETAKTLAQFYFGSEKRMIRLDMSEYQEISSIRRIIGDENGPGDFSQKVRENPFSLVLLDEFEKAHRDLLNLFLSVFDEGYFTDFYGRKVDFKNTIIIATSNAGAELIREAVLQKRDFLTFKRELIDYLIKKRIFKPELLNRFDEILLYKPLEKHHLIKVAHLMLNSLKKRLLEKNIEFFITQELCEKLAEIGYNPEFGARAMRRTIQKVVEDAIAKEIIKGSLKEGDKFILDAKTFKVKKIL